MSNTRDLPDQEVLAMCLFGVPYIPGTRISMLEVMAPLAFFLNDPRTRVGKKMTFVGTIADATKPAKYPRSAYRVIRIDVGGPQELHLYVPSTVQLYHTFNFENGTQVWSKDVFRIFKDGRYMLEFRNESSFGAIVF